MFASLLKELRTQKGVSQIGLAKAIGVSNGNVGDWERGRSKPGYDALIALSRFFEISPGLLLELPDSAPLTCDGVPLSERERDLLAMYRLLPPDHQEDTFELVYSKYQRYVEKKKGAIYSTYCDETPDAEDCAGSHDGGAALA